MEFLVRPYARADRAAVRRICCETGCMGNPIEPLFGDREAFADFFTRYYTDFEPANCLVAEAGGRPVGYLLGSLRPRRYAWVQPLALALATAPRMLARALAGRYRRRDLRFLAWFAGRAWRETPRAPPGLAHFHINLLPDWRRRLPARDLIFRFLDHARARGAAGVYGQIQTYPGRRSDAMFERYGFRVFDRRRVTKFDRLGAGEVHVTTVVRRFAPAASEA